MDYLYKLVNNLKISLFGKEENIPFGKPVGYKNVNTSSTKK
jgi:hypothetical protein